MKYKKGDKVKVIGCDTNHRFKIGEEVVITELFPDGSPPHYRAEGTSNGWWIEDQDVELIKL